MKLTTKAVQEVVYQAENLLVHAQKEMKAANNIKRLSKKKKELLEDLCQSVVMARMPEDWEAEVEACVKDFSLIEGLSPLPEVLQASEEHQLEIYPAALVYHAQGEEKNSQS